MTEYAVVYEQAEDGSWSASALDLPVFAVGDSRNDAERLIREAIVTHIENLRLRGKTVPKISGVVGTVSV